MIVTQINKLYAQLSSPITTAALHFYVDYDYYIPQNTTPRKWKYKGELTTATKTNICVNDFFKVKVLQIIIDNTDTVQHTVTLYLGNTPVNTFTIDPGQSLTYQDGDFDYNPPMTTVVGGGNMTIFAGTESFSSGSLAFINSNDITFGMNAGSITASFSYTGGGGASAAFSANGGSSSFDTLHFLNSNGITFINSGGSLAASYNSTHTHSQYINTSVSSNFQLTSAMSLYQLTANNSLSLDTSYTSHTHSQYQLIANSSLSLGTDYSSHTHSQYQDVTNMSLYQLTADNSLSLGTDYTSHTHSQYQLTADMTNFLNTGYSSHTHSQYQLTSDMTNYLDTGYSSHTHSQYQLSSDMSNYLGTGYTTHTHDYQVTSNMSLYQLTANNSLSLDTGYTTHTHSQYVDVSQSSLFQQTSLMTNYLNTGYTTHTHSLDPAQLSNFQQTSAMSLYQLTADNSLSLGTGYTTHTHDYQQTSAMSLYQLTANNSLSLDTSYTSHTHSQYQLSANMTDYLGTAYTSHNHTQYFSVSLSNQTLGQVIRYNGANWVNDNLPVPIGAGNGVVLFFDEDGSGVGGYESINYYPDTGAEEDEPVVVNNNTVLLHGYATPAVLSRTVLDAGIWEFNLYGYVDDLTASSTFVVDVYSRTSGGSETLLFSVESPSIESTSIALIKVSSTQGQFIINDTDRLVIKVSGKTTHTSNVTVHFIHSGVNHNSHVNTPLAPHHNDLAGLQGGVAGQYYHLNQTEYSYRNTANTSIYQLSSGLSAYQLTSDNSLSLGTGYTTHTHSQYINTSISSNFQQSSLMTNYYSNFYIDGVLITDGLSFQGVHTTNLNNVVFRYDTAGSKAYAIAHIDLSAPNTSAEATAIAFSNSNGISFGLNTANSVITASHNGITSQFTHAFSANGGSSTFDTLFFKDNNGVTFSNSAGGVGITHALQYTSNTSNITSNAFNTSASSNFVLTANSSLFQHTSATVAQSVQPVAVSGSNGSFNFSTLSLGALNGISFYSSNGSIVASHNALTSQSNQAWSASNGSSAFQTLSFADSNGISWSNNAGSVVVTHSLQYLSNTSGITSAALHTSSPRINISAGTTSSNLSAFTFQNSNNVSFGLDGARITATATFAQSVQPVAISASNGSFTYSTVTFGNLNGLSFYTSNGSVVGSYTVPGGPGGGLTLSAGTESISAGSVVFSNANGVSFGLDGSTVTASAGIPYYKSNYSPPHAWSGMATNSSLGNNTVYFQPFDIEWPIYASRLNLYVSLSGALSAANSTGTCWAAIGYALYKKDTGANSLSLSQITSYSMSIVQHSMSSNTQYAATHYIGLQDASSHSTSQYAASATNATTYLATSVNGLRQVAMPMFSSFMTPGRYWLAISNRTTAGNGMTNGMSVAITSVGVQPEVRPWGINSASATNVSVFRRLQGWGSYSATTNVFPSAIAFTTDNIRAAVNQTIIHFDIGGYPYQGNVLN